ncbi:uncharacterized protein V1516DRAFT_552464 [Lipomyces oligophaga]|uniref:uncharacterized protein n=1 Tax=Lipomyces oligophaga TaxID=45792 RepID=UPI0034CE4CB8
MDNLQSQIESLPGYDVVMDMWTDYAGDKLQTKDPYFEEMPDGSTRKRRAPPGTTEQDARAWKHIVKTAWQHDRCLCGCYWADWGIGQAPLISIIPVIGPWIMYTMHLRLNTMADDIGIPAKLHAKMVANVTFDFLLTLVPVLGAVFSYLNACSTRNAALVHTYLVHKGQQNASQLGNYRTVRTEYGNRNDMPTTRLGAGSTREPSSVQKGTMTAGSSSTNGPNQATHSNTQSQHTQYTPYTSNPSPTNPQYSRQQKPPSKSGRGRTGVQESGVVAAGSGVHSGGRGY